MLCDYQLNQNARIFMLFSNQILLKVLSTCCICYSQNKKMIKNTSIKVAIKIKPAPPTSKHVITRTIIQEGLSPTVEIALGSQTKKFQVDAVHDANISKNSMFLDLNIDQLVDKFVNGFHVSVMAYGQTGAGKTYCMEGNQNDTGIIVDSIQRIYEKLSPGAIVSCSYIQLYNQKIFDLLADEQAIFQNLKLRWQHQRDFIVEDLTTHTARSAKQMQKIWKKGTKNRIIASNKIHDASSRSHALFFITISDRDQQDNLRIRQMTFVDLAGSERLFDHLGKLSKQSIQINKSLFSLRKCIKILQEASVYKKQLYVPYRDSKLTSLLKKALGGNCLTIMIACIDSLPDQKEETLLTLSYAISTGRIQNSAHVNIDQQAFQNKQLKIQNQKLKKQLQAAWRQLDLMHRKQKMQAEKKSMNQYSHKIIQCIGTIRQLIRSNKQLRQQLDEQRKITRQQKIEIQMLMQERYLLRKYHSLSQSPSPSPSPRKVPGSMSFLDNTSEGKINDDLNRNSVRVPVINEKQEVSAHQIIRIRQVLGSTGYISPMKGQSNPMTRRPNNTVNKRKKYIFKTQPDQMLVNFNGNDIKPGKKQDRMYEKVQKTYKQ